MKLITRDTDYAIRALCYIAKSKKTRISVDELVLQLSVPRPFLRKILQVLTKKKVLNSYKGQGGGFKLAVSPSQITLVNLIKVFQGKLSLNECTFKKMLCRHIKTCILRKKIDNIQKYVFNELKNITLSSLLKELR